MEIFKLFGSILIDTTDADNSLSKTEKKTESFGSKLKSGITTVAKWGTAIAGAAAGAATAMTAMAKSAADALGDIDDAAQRVGVDAETMQELQYVAEMSGMSLNDLEKAAKKLEGTDLNLDQAIDEIMSLGTAEEQTQKAIDLFGESVAYKMQPLLNQGADGIEAFKEQARDLGIVVSNSSVEAGASFGDLYDAVTKSISTMKTSLSAELMPYITEVLQWIVDHLPEIKAAVDGVVDGIKTAIEGFQKFWEEHGDTIKKYTDFLFTAIKTLIKAALKIIQEIVQAVFKLLEGDFDGFVQGIINAIKTLATTLYNLGKNAMTMLWEGFKSVWTGIANWVSEKVAWIGNQLAAGAATSTTLTSGGVHASGLRYVPYDGYVATLHKGERVLNSYNANEMDRLSEDKLSETNALLRAILQKDQTIKLNGRELGRVVNAYAG